MNAALPKKGWTRLAFEHALRLTPDQCVMANGHYADGRIHDMYSAFKAGLGCRPSQGTFVIAELHNSQPSFPETEAYMFRDLARNAQRERAHQTGAVVAVFQQISTYDPSWIRA